MISKPDIKIISDQGSGRAFIILVEAENYSQLGIEIATRLASKCRAILVRCPLIDYSNWETTTKCLLDLIEDLKIRQSSFLGLGSAGTIIQNLVLINPKIVRSLVLADATTRAHPNRWVRFLDFMEAHLPMGLPFRSVSPDFDGKAFLQRIRCPTLLAITEQASQHVIAESNMMVQRIPTSWLLEVNDRTDYLVNMVIDFQEVPAKCPQKGLKRQAHKEQLVI